MKLGVASRAANGIVIFARENGIDGLVVRALPYLYGAGRYDRAFPLGIHQGARSVRLESCGIIGAEFIRRKAEVLGYELAISVPVLEFSVPRILADVIANRYTTANAYHQLSKLPESEWDSFLDWLWDFEFRRLGLPAPDRVLLLDMPESVSESLVYRRSSETGVRLDIHEKDTGYLKRCRDAAHYVAEKCGWSVVECAADGMTEPYSRDEIAERIRGCLADLL